MSSHGRFSGTGSHPVVLSRDGKDFTVTQSNVRAGAEIKVTTERPNVSLRLTELDKGQYEGLGGKKPLPGTAEAEDRFVRGAYYLTQLPENPTSYQEAVAGVLSVIRNMATPIGFVDPVKPNVSPTQWRTISDLTNKRYYFELTNMPNVVWLDLDKLNLKAGAPVQMFDLASDLEAAGEVSGKFQPAKPLEFQKAGTAVTWKPAPKSR